MGKEIPWWDYHIHCKLCGHAVGNLEGYVQKAIERNLPEIGLSDHFPMYYLPAEANAEHFAMKLEKFPEYLAECEFLRDKYKDQIKIKIGSEVDYFPGTLANLQEHLNPFLSRMDYLIGSIHVIHLDGYLTFPVDGPEILKKFKEIGEEPIYKEYYRSTIEMVRSGYYNIVGHCDLPKKFGTYYGNLEPIRKIQMEFLDAVKDSGMAIEINHSGLFLPAKEQYPSDSLIREIIRREIPITFGSDAHRPKDVGLEFKGTFEKCLDYAREFDVDLILAEFSHRILIPHKFSHKG
ncbi:MAG: histidinol-phosphatase HisJ [Promethearchaeota archaeon]